MSRAVCREQEQTTTVCYKWEARVSIEHRKSERLDAEYLITMRIEGEPPATAFARGKMTNLSRGGLCFLGPYALK